MIYGTTVCDVCGDYYDNITNTFRNINEPNKVLDIDSITMHTVEVEGSYRRNECGKCYKKQEHLLTE